MLTLPETIAQTLLLLFFISPRQQYRVCAIVSGSVSMLSSPHNYYSCFIFHPCLVSFAIPICPPFRNPQDFLLTCLHSFLYIVVMETIMYKVSSPCVLSLRNEEVILKKISRGYILLVVVMETIVYTCVPSVTSMCAILSKFEE